MALESANRAMPLNDVFTAAPMSPSTPSLFDSLAVFSFPPVKRIPQHTPKVSSASSRAIFTSDWAAATGSQKMLRRGSVDPVETLAVRRYKSANRDRPSLVRRQTKSLELLDGPNCLTVELDLSHLRGLPSELEEEDEYFRTPLIQPLNTTAFRSVRLEDRTPTSASSISSSVTASSSCSSSELFVTSSTSSTFATISTASSIGSAWSTMGNQVSAYPLPPPPPSTSGRRVSAPPRPAWHLAPLSSCTPMSSGIARSSSDQGLSTNTYPTSPPLAGAVKAQQPSNVQRQQSTPCSTPLKVPQQPRISPSESPSPIQTPLPLLPSRSTPKSFASASRSSAFSRREKGKARSFPSPLSASHTPEELAGDLTATTAGPTQPRMEFPFPPSPSISTFSLEAGTAHTPGANETPPASPIRDERRSEAIRPFSMNRAERARAHSSGVISPPRPYRSLASPTAHLRSASVSSPTPSPTKASVAAHPLTPPEFLSGASRHLTSAAELAWHDLGLGHLGVAALPPPRQDYSSLNSATMAHRSDSSHIMSLGDMEPLKFDATAALAAETGSSTATPKEGPVKRVGNEDLMGGSSGGHFGPATQDKLGRIMRRGLQDVPLPSDGGTVQIVEYGALSSRSTSLIAPIISSFAKRQSPAIEPFSFQVTHADKIGSDFRLLSQQLNAHSDSYLSQVWQTSHQPSLENSVFSSFVSRPFGARILPKASVSVGFSAMSLHWLSTERKYRTSPETIAHGELMAFLSARATEFRAGGLLSLAFISRSDDESTSTTSPVMPVVSRTSSSTGVSLPRAKALTPDEHPVGSKPLMRERSCSLPAITSTKKRDIWATLSSVLGKAIQRLVSTQLLKPAVARQLLAMPIYARTALQTDAALRSAQHAWKVEANEITLLTHPVWKGLEHKTVSTASYIEHTVQLLKIFWEAEMRSILRDALLSRAACEWILEGLFDIVREKIEEEGPQPLELEVQIIALRRRED